MLRVLLTIVLPLVLPTALYLAWVRTTQPEEDGGAVRWRLDARPLAVNACHCMDCKKSTGATNVLMLLARNQDFSFSGETQVYRKRAGVEASLSNAVRQHGARWARYRGLIKTGLQHLWLASAINLKRATAWLIGRRPRTERQAGLRTLAAAPS